MWAGLGVNALVGQPEPLYGTAVDQVLLHDLRGVFRPYTAIPHGLGIDDHRGPVLALVQAERLVDAHLGAQTSGLGQLLQLGEQLALSIGGAGRAGRTFGTDVMANKDMVFKKGQRIDPPASRLTAAAPPKEVSTISPPDPPASAKIVA
jgi:hypothetical protein